MQTFVSVLSVMQYLVIRYRPIPTARLRGLFDCAAIRLYYYRYNAKPIKVGNQRSHRLNRHELITFELTLPEDEPNSTSTNPAGPSCKLAPLQLAGMVPTDHT